MEYERIHEPLSRRQVPASPRSPPQFALRVLRFWILSCLRAPSSSCPSAGCMLARLGGFDLLILSHRLGFVVFLDERFDEAFRSVCCSRGDFLMMRFSPRKGGAPVVAELDDGSVWLDRLIPCRVPFLFILPRPSILSNSAEALVLVRLNSTRISPKSCSFLMHLMLLGTVLVKFSFKKSSC